MNVYKVFTTERNDSFLPANDVLNVTVMANTEQEALDLVDEIHGEEFVGAKEKRQVAFVCHFIGLPMIVNVEYDLRSF